MILITIKMIHFLSGGNISGGNVIAFEGLVMVVYGHKYGVRSAELNKVTQLLILNGHEKYRDG